MAEKYPFLCSVDISKMISTTCLNIFIVHFPRIFIFDISIHIKINLHIFYGKFSIFLIMRCGSNKKFMEFMESDNLRRFHDFFECFTYGTDILVHLSSLIFFAYLYDFWHKWDFALLWAFMEKGGWYKKL